MISIYEITRILQRSPLKLSDPDIIFLARYLVEPKNSAELEFDQLAEAPLKVILLSLQSLIGDYKLLNEEEEGKLIDGIKQKLIANGGELVEELKSSGETDVVSLKSFEEILKQFGIIFTNEELEALALPAFQVTRSVRELSCAYLVAELEKLVPAEEQVVEKKQNEEEKLVESAKKPAEEKKGDEIPFEIADASKKLEEKTGENDTEYQSIDEDQMILIAQKCFYDIAQKLIDKKLNVYSLYKGKILKRTVDGEEVELLAQLDFINGIQELELEDLQPLQYACLIQVLAINDEEKYVRVSDLIQILEDYGVVENAAKPVDKEPGDKEPAVAKEPVAIKEPVAKESVPVAKPVLEQKKVEPENVPEAENPPDELLETLNFEDLDKVSMVLMLALTEYMIKSQVSLQDLFGKAIFVQEVINENEKVQVEFLESTEFFAVLARIGINIEEKEHENLKHFLCYSESAPNKFCVEKLAIAVEEFGNNEELRGVAHKCYEQLVNEDFEEEEGEGEER